VELHQRFESFLVAVHRNHLQQIHILYDWNKQRKRRGNKRKGEKERKKNKTQELSMSYHCQVLKRWKYLCLFFSLTTYFTNRKMALLVYELSKKERIQKCNLIFNSRSAWSYRKRSNWVI